MLNRPLSLLILGAALGAPILAQADIGYGRVIRVEPSMSVTYSDGRSLFDIQYERGGERYWIQSDTYPGPWVKIPVPPSHAYYYNAVPGYDREEHHWWRHHDRDDRD